MKKSFTMIELIFVIVILGILAAVALPKFVGNSDNAHESNLIAFTKTLNRTTGPDLWGISITEGKKGSIKSFESITKYVQIPKELNVTDLNMSKCGDGEYKTIAGANSKYLSEEYNITCKDGTESKSPYFKLVRGDGEVLVERDE